MATRIVSVETVLVNNLGGASSSKYRYIYNRSKYGSFMSKLVKMLL